MTNGLDGVCYVVYDYRRLPRQRLMWPVAELALLPGRVSVSALNRRGVEVELAGEDDDPVDRTADGGWELVTPDGLVVLEPLTLQRYWEWIDLIDPIDHRVRDAATATLESLHAHYAHEWEILDG